ncbi:MAG: DNA polymerase III subunit alpha, partial [Clostridia bacterium]|nr:DNA polymerase III subunit alpha [Clostridia bacterium]
SLLDGACRITDPVTNTIRLFARAKELGQTAVAITDHGVMYGVVDFYRAAKEAGIKPIIGCEVYVAKRSMQDRVYDLDGESAHLVLLCKNETGYRNLTKLVSAAFTDGFYIKPRVDHALLRRHSEGLICLSACLAGEIPKLLSQDNFEGACAVAREYREIFGADNFYLEVQDHGIPEQKICNNLIFRMSEELGIPVVATNDVHYLERSDAEIQDIMLCIQTGSTVDAENRMRFEGSEFYLKSEEEMAALFPEHPEVLDLTAEIAERCNMEFEFGKYHLPKFQVPDGRDSLTYFKDRCREGFAKRYPDAGVEHRERLEYEMQMIEQMGFTDYFLIVSDFVAFARSENIPVGPGRGSAAGSMVSYCLYITDIDPMRYALYFERFLNPERVTMPDIDVDITDLRRKDVIDYVKRLYGEDRVAQIVTFGTMAAKGAIRDVARVLNVPYADADRIAKMVPNAPHMTLDTALKASPDLADAYENDATVRRIIDVAKGLEGMPRNTSTHASGVVITREPVVTYVPLSKNDDTVITQFTMTTIEELGLLKMDFLGLRNLSIIDDTVAMVRAYQPDFDIHSIDYDDPETYEMLSEGKTQGVFQMESQGMTNVVVGLRPQSIEDITAVIALFRPGPMESIPRYTESRHNPHKITYKHPLLVSILEVTYGCIVYQEQVMEIFRKLAGYSLGRADIVRRAMGKKKMDVLMQERKNFIFGNAEAGIRGCIASGVPENVANELFEEILEFANYAFNKAHATGYAVVAFQTAYLKCHYPKEYMASLLSSVQDSTSDIAKYSAECKTLGISVLPPHVNHSGVTFAVEGQNIRYGLAAIKNVGVGLIETLVREREENGLFSDFYDFCDRMCPLDMNKRALEFMIKCGALDGMGMYRSQMSAIFERVCDSILAENRSRTVGQMDLFGGVEETADVQRIPPPDLDEFPMREMLSMEKETCGLYLTGNPMDAYRDVLRAIRTEPLGEILADYDGAEEGKAYPDGKYVTVAGIISSAKMKTTKNNSTMAYVDLDDGTANLELIVFSRTLTLYGGYIKADNAVLVRGRISARENQQPKIIVDDVGPVNEATVSHYLSQNPGNRQTEVSVGKAQAAKRVERKLYLRITDENRGRLPRVKASLRCFTGDTCVILYDEPAGVRMQASRELWVDPCDVLLGLLTDLLGRENVVLK